MGGMKVKKKSKSTRRAPRFSSSWSEVETPRSTELTPSLRRHQAVREITVRTKEKYDFLLFCTEIRSHAAVLN